MSQLFDWSDEHLTGIAEIDAHHKALAGLLNELHESVHRRRGVVAPPARARRRLRADGLVGGAAAAPARGRVSLVGPRAHGAGHDDGVLAVQTKPFVLFRVLEIRRIHEDSK